MTVAIVLINVAARETNRVAEEIAGFGGVSEVYSVGGTFDLVAVARVKDNESLAALVTEQIRGVAGISRTETLIAFRSYSRRDLEALLEMS